MPRANGHTELGDMAFADESDWDEDLAEEDDDTASCPNCSALIYHDVEQCPSCGSYITSEDFDRTTRPFWVILVAILLLTFGLWFWI